MSRLISSNDYGSSVKSLYTGSTIALGNSFRSNLNCYLDKCKFYTRKVGTPPGNVVALLYEHSGTFSTSSIPTGSALATSDSILASAIGHDTLTEFVFSGENRYLLERNVNYVIVLSYNEPTSSVSNCIQGGYTTIPSTEGNYCTSPDLSTWTAYAGRIEYYVYGDAFVIGNNFPLPAFKR